MPKTKRKLKTTYKYTVVLLYPDYMSDSFGHETYSTWVEAKDNAEALRKARKACRADNPDVHDLEDLHCLFCCKGHVDNLSTEG